MSGVVRGLRGGVVGGLKSSVVVRVVVWAGCCTSKGDCRLITMCVRTLK